jgi:rhodanese-related sulfurtransferase
MSDPGRARRYFEEKLAFTTGPAELDRWIRSNEEINVVDVRRREDYESGHIPCAVSLPKERWDSAEGLRKDRLNVLYCYSQVCHLAATAAALLSSKGYSVMELEGGFQTWKDYGLPIERRQAVSTGAGPA